MFDSYGSWHRLAVHNSLGDKDMADNKRAYVAVIYCSKAAEMETGNSDSVALYFDLVYNRNGSTSQKGRPPDKKAVPYVENREKT